MKEVKIYFKDVINIIKDFQCTILTFITYLFGCNLLIFSNYNHSIDSIMRGILLYLTLICFINEYLSIEFKNNIFNKKVYSKVKCILLTGVTILVLLITLINL